MALSVKAKKVLTAAVANKIVGAELAAAIDASGSGPASAVAAISGANMTAAVVSAATLVASAGTWAIGAEPTGTEVDTAITASQAKVKAVLDVKADNVDLETLRTEAEARLDDIEAKINAVIAALKAAGLMSA